MLIVKGIFTNFINGCIKRKFEIHYKDDETIEVQIIQLASKIPLYTLNISRDQLRNFINNVLNKSKQFEMFPNAKGLWQGDVVGFLPPASADKAYDAESALILVGQQMARANRGELQVSPQILEKFGLESQQQVSRSVLPLLQTSREFAVENQLWDALKDEPPNPLNGKTLLMFRAFKGDLPRVRFLIERGANVNYKSSEGITALTFATLGGHLAVVRELLDRGADINVRGNSILNDVKDGTPLDTAIILNNQEIIEELRRRGGKERSELPP